MKNFNIKAVFLIILIIAETVFCTKLVYYRKKPDTNTTGAIVSVLEKNNIHIASDLIDDSEYRIYDCTMRYAVNSKDTLAKKMLGNNAVKASGSDNIYTAGNNQLTFSGSKFLYAPQPAARHSDFYNLDSSNAGSKAKKAFEQYGFNLDGSIITISSDNDKFSADITKTINSLPIFNDSMRIEMSRTGISLVSGVWYTSNSPLSNARFAKSASDALLEFMNSNHVTKTHTTVDSFTIGYLLSSPDKPNSPVKAVWRIILSDGTIYYIDA